MKTIINKNKIQWNIKKEVPRVVAVFIGKQEKCFKIKPKRF